MPAVHRQQRGHLAVGYPAEQSTIARDWHAIRDHPGDSGLSGLVGLARPDLPVGILAAPWPDDEKTFAGLSENEKAAAGGSPLHEHHRPGAAGQIMRDRQRICAEQMVAFRDRRGRRTVPVGWGANQHAVTPRCQS